MTILKNRNTSDHKPLFVPLIWNIKKQKHLIYSIDMKLATCCIDMKHSADQKHFIEILHWYETPHCYETLHRYKVSDMLHWYVCEMKHVIYVKHVLWYWKTETHLIKKSYWLHWYDFYFFGCHYFKVKFLATETCPPFTTFEFQNEFVAFIKCIGWLRWACRYIFYTI